MQGNQDQESQDVEQTSFLRHSKHCSTAGHLLPGLRKTLLIYFLLRISQH